MNASAMRQSHQAKLVQLTSLPANSGTFNYLFKVLRVFPSKYLFSIGFKHKLSFRRSLPPTLRSTPKERDSDSAFRTRGTANDRQDAHLLCKPFYKEFSSAPHTGIASFDHTSRLESQDFHAKPIPIHSPFLREYYLVSFPPLSYLSRFSRFSGLTSRLRIKIYTLVRLDHT